MCVCVWQINESTPTSIVTDGEDNDDKFNLGKIEEDREGEEQAHTEKDEETGEEDGSGVTGEVEAEPAEQVGEEHKEEQQEQDA